MDIDTMLEEYIGGDITGLVQARARSKHIYFMQYCWMYKNRPFLSGLHTREICDRIDRAFDDFRNGISTYLIILVCFRHGKSEITSRFAVPHFLAEFPDCEVIVTSHDAGLANKFSRYSQAVLKSEAFAELYPEIKLSTSRCSVEEWGIEGRHGKAQYWGIQGGIVGSGGDMVIIDDFFKNREQAESIVIRDKIWDNFTESIFSRMPHPAIMLIPVSPWHCDDLVGRIKKSMNEDTSFPKFEIMKFPAFDDRYPEGVLFPERFPREWYDENKSVKISQGGMYTYLSQMQCEPQERSGGILRVDKIGYYDKITDVVDNPKWVRGWDLASSVKQKIKSDPDYTVGIKLCVVQVQTAIPGIQIPIIYIDDMVRGRWEALERQKIIRDTALRDGAECQVYHEAFGAYKDAYTEIRDTLRGIISVYRYEGAGDKVSRTANWSPALEAGNFFMRRAPWNEVLLTEMISFPQGHDDIIDAVSVAFWGANKKHIAKVMTIDTVTSDNDAKNQFLKDLVDRCTNFERVGCSRDDYFSYVRKFLVELSDKSNNGTKTHIDSEVARLDNQFGYSKITMY